MFGSVNRRQAVRGTTLTVALVLSTVAAAREGWAQTPAPAADSRAATIVAAEQAKAGDLKPIQRGKGEAIFKKVEEAFLTGNLHWHPFFRSAYNGGGFTLGAGYARHVSSYNLIDVRGSYTVSGYKRIEAEFIAPRLFDRRATLSVLGGWREATQVGFYGFGTPNTSADDRANYSFEQPYGAANLELRPTRRFLLFGAGVEYSQWKQGPGEGSAPSVEEIYTPDTLVGLGADPTYLHLTGTAALDWRTSPGYSRSGGYYGATYHDFADQDDQFGFSQVDYEAIQHIPLGRDFWVLSLHGLASTTNLKSNEEIPFFMQPALGGGSNLRGFSSWRFRDRHSILFQAEMRVIASPFIDLALFYDAGKVTAKRSDLDFDDLKTDFGIGFRLHGPAVTPLRIELAKSNEGLALIFSSSAVF